VHKLRILIADDFAEFRRSFGDALESQRGIAVVGRAKDGLEAVSMAKILKPDVIFLDISMPRMGGVEASMQIKSEMPEVKIYFVTVHDERTFEALGEICDVDGFLSKNSLQEALPRVVAGLQHPVKQVEVPPVATHHDRTTGHPIA
jgi:two-component system NarL family response regulator